MVSGVTFQCCIDPCHNDTFPTVEKDKDHSYKSTLFAFKHYGPTRWAARINYLLKISTFYLMSSLLIDEEPINSKQALFTLFLD